MQTADTPAPASVPRTSTEPTFKSTATSTAARVDVRTVAPLLFFSGLCALIYQVAWLRDLRLVFGASTAASAAVLAVFMGGLGLGGWLLGKRADRHPRPLWLYANLELGVAVTAGLTPLLVLAGRQLYIAIGGSTVLGPTGATIARLLLTALILGASTIMMGGTLPAAARSVARSNDAKRRDVGTLYAVNTLGAVTGAFLANFLLLEVFGTRITLWLACLVNALVGMCARALARRPARPVQDHESAQSMGDVPARVLSPRLFWFPSFAAAVAGFAFLLMELVWYRMLGPILGGSSYTFGLILCVALLGIGVGGGIYSFFGQNRPATLNGFAWTCALEALCIIIPFAAGDRVALAALILRDLGAMGFLGHVAAWTAVASFVVLPAAIVSGYQFPLIIALFGSGNASLGRHVGIAYAANTAGSIAGSLAGGFGLVPLLSAPGCWRAVGAVLAATGILTAALAVAAERRRLGWLAPAAVGALAAWILFAPGPTAFWRHGGIGAGRAVQLGANSSRNQVEEAIRTKRRWITWEADGVESSVAMFAESGYSFIVNGKSDGNARGDAPTQVMGGLIGAALLPQVRDAFVIGLGTGSTAGWLARVPEMERVDVAELEPVILRVARDCGPVNENVLENPKVHVTIGDARELLLTSRRKYDLVFSEPSNPYRAGVASLFTREFYEAAALALRPGGVFLQWLQVYDVDGQSIQTAIATVGAVFPNVSVWQSQPGDLIVVACREPLQIDADTLRVRLSKEPFRRALPNAWGVADLEGFLAHHHANPTFSKKVIEGQGDNINVDDLNLLEYAVARTLGTGHLLDPLESWKTARGMGADRPDLLKGAVDWEKVDARRVLQLTPADDAFANATFAPGPLAFFADVMSYRAGDLARVRKSYRSIRPVLADPYELWLYSDALAAAGDEQALPLIEALANYNDSEATVLRARFLLAKGQVADSSQLLNQALVRLRADPWARSEALSRAFSLVNDLVSRDPALAQPLFDSLHSTFSVASHEEPRLISRVRLAHGAGLKDRCESAFAPFERSPVWEQWFLEQRYACYRVTGSPLAAGAESDLRDFIANAPVRVGAGIVSEAPGSATNEDTSLPGPRAARPSNSQQGGQVREEAQ